MSSRPQYLARLAAGLVLFSMAGLWLLAASGPSASSPDIGGWSGRMGWSPGVITIGINLCYSCGGLGLVLGLRSANRGLPVPRIVVISALGLAFLAVLVPPMGSADHLNYAAYGRIAAQGGDPYAVSPISWAGGADPITRAVEPPWTTTPSIYGPIATAVQVCTSFLGGTSLRLTVFFWQLFCLLAWLLVAYLGRGRGPRALWLWLANPVLYGVLLLGAHVDLLAAALGLWALTRLQPLARADGTLKQRYHAIFIGVLLGLAIGIKLTIGVFGIAAIIGVWFHVKQRWSVIFWGTLGLSMVLIPSHLAAGAQVFSQLRRARGFISLATPWRPVATTLTDPLPSSVVRTAISILAVPLFLVMAWAIWRLLVHAIGPATDILGTSARVATALAAGYILSAPYSLPWYDAAAWAPLLLLGASSVDGLLLLRLASYAIAYVPGRVLGSTEQVTDHTLGFRRSVMPWVGWLLWLALGVLYWRARGRGSMRRGITRSVAE